MSKEPQSILVRYNPIQDWIGLVALLGMVLGFMVSRALLSISMIALALNTLWPLQLKLIYTRFSSNYFALLCVVYFGINFIGGFWSEKQDTWLDIVTLNLAFIAMPLGMHSVPLSRMIFRKRFLAGLYAIIGSVILVSLTTFFSDMSGYIEGYNHSKVIPTNQENDHIRFSLFLALSLLPGYAYLKHDYPADQDITFKRLIIVAMVVIVAYLHILSAKTGLAALYILVGITLFTYLYRQGKKLQALLLPPLALLIIFTIGYLGSNTLRNKVDYIVHEYEQLFAGKPLDYNYSDAGRIISYEMALKGIEENFWFGTGTGDVWTTMRNNYRQYYPEIPDQNQLIPHNQYLYVLLAFGFVFFPVFLAMVIAPFFNRETTTRFFPIVTAIIFMLAMQAEAMLQVQFGVFVFLFYSCLWFNWRYGFNDLEGENNNRTLF